MAIWAIGDLHLSFGAAEKSMEVFGIVWENYVDRLKKNWQDSIHDDDLILIPGDISWASDFEQALVDLRWIDALPGRKVILKGNHDYWWPSNRQLIQKLPASICFVNNNVFNWEDVTIGGTRLWETEEYSFKDCIDYQECSRSQCKEEEDPVQREKIYNRELKRLKLSLSQLNKQASLRIAMTHYPPISVDLRESKVSEILEEYWINICIFGHLHNIKRDRQYFGEKNHILYLCVSADYLGFKPLKIR